MDNGCWFNLPNGETAKELEVTIPVKGRKLCSANIMEEVDQWRDLMHESMKKRGFINHGRLGDMLAACLAGYEGVAADALNGASHVRDDMLVMLRSVVFVLETVVGDHLNHFQKNERIRGAIGVLERHIQSLREERFNFRGSTWRRDRDLFHWDEPERRLREKIRELEGKLRAEQDENLEGIHACGPFSE